MVLDGREVPEITSGLTAKRRQGGEPRQLAEHLGESFQGSILVGRGFVLDADEAQRLISEDSRNRSVVRPYLGGQELNNDPEHRPSRWAIDFFDMPEEEARSFPSCWAIVEAKVKPERQRRRPDGSFALRSPQPQRYWQYADKRPALYRLLKTVDTSVVTAQVGTQMPVRVSSNQILDAKIIAFPRATDSMWGALTSAFHQLWVVQWTTTLQTTLTYVPTRVFDTFPFPREDEVVAETMRRLSEYRANLMRDHAEGLTKTYNKVNNPEEQAAPIQGLRDLHIALDHAVRAAYDWSDLALDHCHWETPQGMRFTVSPAAKDELLDRLLELNHERYAAEVAAGLHDKKGERGKRNPKGGASQGSLL
jgi:hypothetical protein